MNTHSISSYRFGIAITALLLTIFAANQLNAGVLCVSNTGKDVNTGAPDSPFLHIQSALNLASAGDTIKVAAGTYTEYLNTKSSIVLLGGYTGSFSNNNRDIFLNKTYIDGISAMMYNDTHGSKIDGFIFTCNSYVSSDAIQVTNNSTFSNNIVYGYLSSSGNSAVDITGGATVINNIIHGGWYALGIYSGDGTPSIRNNIVTGSTFGISTISYDASVRVYNNVYGNTHNYTGFDNNPGMGDFSLDPEFKDELNFDFRVLESSPCVDAGDPSDSPGLELSPYNTRIDIGAYGGTIHSPYLPAIPDAPVLSLPVNNTVNAPVSLTLKWKDIHDINGFDLQVATDIGFTSGIVYEDISISDTAIQLPNLSYNTTYYWRVRASVTLGTSEWSDIWQFTTLILDKPILYWPKKGKINPDVLIWASVSNAENYNLQIAGDSLFSIIVTDSVLADTTMMVDPLNSNHYFWRVQALNTDGEGPWSEIWNFSIDNHLLFFEDFESYPLGILADASGSPWVRLSASRVGDVTNTRVHSGERSFQINSFTTITEIDYVKSNLDYKPAQVNVELWYNPDGYFIYKDFAEIGLGYAYSKYDMEQLLGLYGNGHNMWFTATGMAEDTLVFNELEYDQYNYLKVEFDFQNNEARFYIGLDTDAPWRATINFDGSLEVNALYLSGGLNPTYIDDIYVTIDGIYIPTAPKAPVPLSPVDGASDQSTFLSLNWELSGGATSYHLQVDDNNDFSSPFSDHSDIKSTSMLITGLAYDHTYYWRVCASNEIGTSPWSDTLMFTTTATVVCNYDWAGTNPTVHFYHSSGNLYDVEITLNNVGYCSVLSIKTFSIAIDNNISLTYSYPNSGSLTGTISADGNTFIGEYSIGNNDCGGNKSGSWSAIRLSPIPSVPEPDYPNDNAQNLPMDVTITWNAVTNATNYALQVSKSQNFTTNVIDSNDISSTSCALSDLENSTVYYWRVSSMNECQESGWSETRSFTTASALGFIEPNADEKIKLYPNPVSNTLYFDGIEMEVTCISILTSDGRILLQMTENIPDHLNVYDLQKGVYFIQWLHSRGIVTRKFIKQ